jgi:hypothetical protein
MSNVNRFEMLHLLRRFFCLVPGDYSLLLDVLIAPPKVPAL